MAARKKAVAKRKTNTSIANIEQQLAEEAAQVNETIGNIGGNIIKVDQATGEYFEIPGLGQAPAPMKAVILDYISQNHLYEGKYNPNNIQPPICFGISRVVNAMVPSNNSPEPQADKCSECAMNEFGSDGNGKACKNSRLLALLPPDAEDDAEIMVLRVSPTGLKNFDQYVAGISKRFNKPPIGVVTEISIVPSGAGFTVAFGNPEPNTNLGSDFARRVDAQAMLEAEPDYSSYGEQSTKKAPRRAKKKVVARKKTTAKRR